MLDLSFRHEFIYPSKSVVPSLSGNIGGDSRTARLGMPLVDHKVQIADLRPLEKGEDLEPGVHFESGTQLSSKISCLSSG